MKKVLLEYVNMFAYTITGLIFGLSFFLLFLNFYHMDELSSTVDVTSYNETNLQKVQSKVDTIKNNINVYDQNSYSGSLNIYGLNSVQMKLQQCIDVIESDEMMKFFKNDKIAVKDTYDFLTSYRTKILNNCLVLQIKSMFNSDTISTLPNYDIIKPYVDLNVDTLLSSTDYVQNNIENADHYYFSTESNKINFFNLVEDSYTYTMEDYQETLDLLVNISNWYRNVVIGG